MPVLTPGPTTRIGSVRPAECEALPLADQRRDGRGEADAVDRIEVEHAAEQHAELVARPRALRGDAPVLRQPVTVVEPEDGLGVADIDSEQHQEIVGARRASPTGRPRTG